MTEKKAGCVSSAQSEGRKLRIIALKTLRTFWDRHPDARPALQAWYDDARRAVWSGPADIKKVYRNAPAS